jgi:hypothetical protein
MPPVVESIPIGPPVALVQNQVYALPGLACILFTDTAGTFQLSNSLAFTANVPVVLTNGAAPVSAGWIRATTAGAVITLRKA